MPTDVGRHVGADLRVCPICDIPTDVDGHAGPIPITSPLRLISHIKCDTICRDLNSPKCQEIWQTNLKKG